MARQKTTKAILAANLKCFREAKGLTRFELSKRAKLSEQYCSLAEKGKVNATLEVLDKLSKVLGVSAGDLIQEQSKMATARAAVLVIDLLREYVGQDAE